MDVNYHLRSENFANCDRKARVLGAVQLAPVERDFVEPLQLGIEVNMESPGSQAGFERGHLLGIKQGEGENECVFVAEVLDVVGPRISLLYVLTKGSTVVKHWADPSLVPLTETDVSKLFPPEYCNKLETFNRSVAKLLLEKHDWIAPLSLFSPKKLTQEIQFATGGKYEAVDLNSPQNIWPVTCQAVGRSAVVVHFDGWDDAQTSSYPLDSIDIFPSGWCEANGYPLSTLDGADVSQPQIKRRKVSFDTVSVGVISPVLTPSSSMGSSGTAATPVWHRVVHGGPTEVNNNCLAPPPITPEHQECIERFEDYLLDERREAFYMKKYGDRYKEALAKAGPVIDRLALHQEMVEWALNRERIRLQVQCGQIEPQLEVWVADRVELNKGIKWIRQKKAKNEKMLKQLGQILKKGNLRDATNV